MKREKERCVRIPCGVSRKRTLNVLHSSHKVVRRKAGLHRMAITKIEGKKFGSVLSLTTNSGCINLHTVNNV